MSSVISHHRSIWKVIKSFLRGNGDIKHVALMTLQQLQLSFATNPVPPPHPSHVTRSSQNENSNRILKISFLPNIKMAKTGTMNTLQLNHNKCMSRSLQIRLMNDRIENMKIMIHDYQEAQLAASRVEKLIERVKVILDENSDNTEWTNDDDGESKQRLITFDTPVENVGSNDIRSLSANSDYNDDEQLDQKQRMEVSNLTEAYEEETVKFHLARRSEYDIMQMDESQARIDAIVDAADDKERLEQPRRNIGQIILRSGASWRKSITRISSRSLQGAQGTVRAN